MGKLRLQLQRVELAALFGEIADTMKVLIERRPIAVRTHVNPGAASVCRCRSAAPDPSEPRDQRRGVATDVPRKCVPVVTACDRS